MRTQPHQPNSMRRAGRRRALVSPQRSLKSPNCPLRPIKPRDPPTRRPLPKSRLSTRFRPVPSAKAIHYYQPVYWKESCGRCHLGFEGVDAFSRADMPLDQGKLPFRVVKVIIPDSETQEAITWNRALLAAIGILTVFLAMVILYVIIRYVVVKPLKHLRDVSEEISRGNTELRAEIATNDEFEELASAFNRMLRHLTDAQDELRQVNADLDAKVDQLAQLNMQLYEMNRLKSDFLANMSHELRTPLNSIIGFSEILGGIDTLTDKQKRYAQNIQKSGRLLLDLINDILDLAKIEAGKMDVRLSEFRIGAVATAQCDMVRGLSEEKNIDLICQVEPDLPVMYQDQSKIQQVLINLLSNAIKFTPEGGRITVSVSRSPDDRLVLAVADTGVGIPEEDREIIFEKFRQSSQTVGDRNLTREYSGTGLGLSIVKELCKLLGGEITFVSELGRGSTFTVTVPWVLIHPGFAAVRDRHSVGRDRGNAASGRPASQRPPPRPRPCRHALTSPFPGQLRSTAQAQTPTGPSSAARSSQAEFPVATLASPMPRDESAAKRKQLSPVGSAQTCLPVRVPASRSMEPKKSRSAGTPGMPATSCPDNWAACLTISMNSAR